MHQKTRNIRPQQLAGVQPGRYSGFRQISDEVTMKKMKNEKEMVKKAIEEGM